MRAEGRDGPTRGRRAAAGAEASSPEVPAAPCPRCVCGRMSAARRSSAKNHKPLGQGWRPKKSDSGHGFRQMSREKSGSRQMSPEKSGSRQMSREKSGFRHPWTSPRVAGGGGSTDPSVSPKARQIYRPNQLNRTEFKFAAQHSDAKDITVISKGFTTLNTFKKILSSMASFMSLETTVKCKGFNTYIFFYAFDSHDMESFYNIDYIHRTSLQDVFFYVFGDYCVVQRLYHTDYIHRASLQYVFFYVFGDDFVVQRLYHTDYIHRASLQYGLFYVFGDYSDKQRLYHSNYIHKASLQYTRLPQYLKSFDDSERMSGNFLQTTVQIPGRAPQLHPAFLCRRSVPPSPREKSLAICLPAAIYSHTANVRGKILINGFSNSETPAMDVL
ncbi:hypothetical protein U0070_000913 [Myodes glareolus]|uniref:Uncharacterized protein n=1 Tax=Myodes glareolus TaxID=447135 RepID=A0AAW0I0D4_MYOGA